MSTNDLTYVYLEASNALNNIVMSISKATSGNTADTICVAEFASTASLLYPLGDPAGARSAIDKVALHGDTAIGRCIQIVINELTKPETGSTANQTGSNTLN